MLPRVDGALHAERGDGDDDVVERDLRVLRPRHRDRHAGDPRRDGAHLGLRRLDRGDERRRRAGGDPFAHDAVVRLARVDDLAQPGLGARVAEEKRGGVEERVGALEAVLRDLEVLLVERLLPLFAELARGGAIGVGLGEGGR